MSARTASSRRSASFTLLAGLALAGTLGLTACGGDDSSSSSSSAPASAAATTPSGPVTAAMVESCVQGKGLSPTTDKKKTDGARFDADLELQVSVDPASSDLGVFVYPDATAAGTAKTQIDQAGASGTEIVNNSVFAGAAGFTAADAKAKVDQVRSCATTGA